MPSPAGSVQPTGPTAPKSGGSPWRAFLLWLTAVFVCVWAVYPAILTYTFSFGEKATATVAECELGAQGFGRNASDPDVCRGTWRTADGEAGEGEIYNLDATKAEGRTVPVRIGPLGPYAHGWGRAWPASAVGAGVLAMLWALCAYAYRTVSLRSRRAADELLATPGALMIGADGVHHPDGTLHASVGLLEGPPPGHRGLDLPGRPENDGDQLSLSKKKPTRRKYEAVTDPDGRALMFLEHRSDRGLYPETVLSDPSGVPYLLLRRRADHVLSYRLLDTAGTELGTAVPAQPGSLLRQSVRDAAGGAVATAARRRGIWVLRVEEGAAPELRDAAIALLLTRAHDLD